MIPFFTDPVKFIKLEWSAVILTDNVAHCDTRMTPPYLQPVRSTLRSFFHEWNGLAVGLDLLLIAVRQRWPNLDFARCRKV